MRPVLVLGGTGRLGQRIAAAAVAEGAEVVCLARGESGAVPDGARLIAADRRERVGITTLELAWAVAAAGGGKRISHQKLLGMVLVSGWLLAGKLRGGKGYLDRKIPD